MEARAHAALSPSRAPESRAALARAKRILDELPLSESNASAFGYNEAQFCFHEGNMLTHLGDTAATWAAQQSALRLCLEGDYMDRTLTRLDRTVCLVRDGDITGALEYAAVTLAPLSKRQRQGIIAVRGREVLRILPRQQDRPATRQLRELLSPSTCREEERP